MQLGKTTRSLLALTATGILFAVACGDGDDNGMDIKDDGATGGTSGTSTGGSSGTDTGGSSGTAGSMNGGASGMAGSTSGGMSGATTGGQAGEDSGGMAGGGGEDSGGMAGGGGEDTGGTAGAGMAGSAGGGMAGLAGGGMAGGGAGGIAGAGGLAGGGMAGAGGMSGGGAGGAGGVAPTMVYDFENGVQGWGGTTSQSTTQVKDGAYSLAFAHPELNASNISVEVSNPPLWPGTVITVNVWLPEGLDTSGGTYFQMFTNSNNYSNYDVGGNGQRTAQSGAWTTWQYTVPNTFPGGIQVLGFQIGDNTGGTTIPAGNIYIDSITATGGRADCTAVTPPTALHDFEAALPADTYLVDGGGNVTVSQSTDRFYGTGAGSLKVSFAGLPAAASTSEPTKRFIYINKPNVYCGQTMTFHIWLPAGSEAMGAQVLSVFNWYSGFAGTGNLTVTRDDWTTGTLTIPTTVDYRGIQRVGIEFAYTGTSPFTGDAYIDQVSW